MIQLDKFIENSGIRSFSAGELVKHNMPPEALYQNIIPTLTILQAIRDFLGRPIKINSCYRDEKYNQAVGGKKNSLHMQFNAIDFKPAGFTPRELSDLAEDIDANKFAVMTVWGNKLITLTPDILGVGLYDTFIHIDTRGLLGLKAPARWVG
jgi:hypothetical protein